MKLSNIKILLGILPSVIFFGSLRLYVFIPNLISYQILFHTKSYFLLLLNHPFDFCKWKYFIGYFGQSWIFGCISVFYWSCSSNSSEKNMIVLRIYFPGHCQRSWFHSGQACGYGHWSTSAASPGKVYECTFRRILCLVRRNHCAQKASAANVRYGCMTVTAHVFETRAHAGHKTRNWDLCAYIVHCCDAEWKSRATVAL